MTVPHMKETQEEARRMNEIWTTYVVDWYFPWWLCGGVPQNPDIVKDWLEAQMPNAKPPEAREIAEIQEEVLETLSTPSVERKIGINSFQKISGTLVGFPEESAVLVVRASTIRAHLKDCARAVSRYVAGRVKGEAAFSTRFINCVYPDGPDQYWVPILRDGGPLAVEDGWEEKPFSAMTPAGKISAFKRVGYAERVHLQFRLWVVAKSVSAGDLETVMRYGGTHGYGAERGMGHGRYVVERLEPLEGGTERQQGDGYWWQCIEVEQ